MGGGSGCCDTQWVPALTAKRRLFSALALWGVTSACAGPHNRGQIVAPTPSSPEADPLEDEQLEESGLSAGQWLDQAFSLWRDKQYGACTAALREALGSQELNDAGQAMAYWHIYLSEQAMDHQAAATNALADFVTVADAMVSGGPWGLPDTPEAAAFRQRFDLSGRLARARATLNLAWAKQVHRAGQSPAYPLLVFDKTEMSHFLELVPPCGQAHDRRVISEEHRSDPLGRLTTKVTLRCHHVPKDMHYFFAFIGQQDAMRAKHHGPTAKSVGKRR